MSNSAQKIVYENRINLASGEQITLTPAIMGIVFQNLSRAVITQVTAEKGIKHQIIPNLIAPKEITVILYNDTPNNITDAYINVTAQHSIQYKPVVEDPAPAAAPIADASLIRGKEERTFAVLADANNIDSVLPFEDVGESTLPAGTISWSLLPVGRFTLERAGKYQISVVAAVSSDAENLASVALLRDPANVGSGIVVEQQTGVPFPTVTVEDIPTQSSLVALQEIVEVTDLQSAADRTFEARIGGVVVSVISRGFFGQTAGAKCANIIIEKIS